MGEIIGFAFPSYKCLRFISGLFGVRNNLQIHFFLSSPSIIYVGLIDAALREEVSLPCVIPCVLELMDMVMPEVDFQMWNSAGCLCCCMQSRIALGEKGFSQLSLRLS